VHLEEKPGGEPLRPEPLQELYHGHLDEIGRAPLDGSVDGETLGGGPGRCALELEAGEPAATVEEGRRLHAAGAVSAVYVEQAERTLAAARRELEEAQSALDEADRLLLEAALQQRLAVLAPLPRGGFEDTAMLARFNGAARWSLASVPALQQRFTEAFGRALPISAFGQTSVHHRLGLDHRSAIDVAVHPDSAEGRWLMQHLRQAAIPFIGVRAALVARHPAAADLIAALTRA